MLASTAARVLNWYFTTRSMLDSPVMFTLESASPYGDPAHVVSRWDVVPSARRRATLLAEVSTVGLALARISDRDRVILIERCDPERGLTDAELAKALHTDREGRATRTRPRSSPSANSLSRWASYT